MTDREKDAALHWFAARIEEIRNMQPTEAGIHALKTDVEFLLDVARPTSALGRKQHPVLSFRQ